MKKKRTYRTHLKKIAMKKKHILSLTTILLCTALWAQQKDSTQVLTENLNEVVVRGTAILGSKFEVKNRTGSATYISGEELKKFSYSDINRTLKSVPGVNIYEEDGYGLRPNISLRGTSPERSAKITLMEDGVLIAPAPYSAPAAYYFPVVGRMDAVEILKGSSQVQYGPNTTGGAINMISRQIPEKLSGKLSLSAGNFSSKNVQASIGNSHNNFGYAGEFFNYSSDGFKNIDGGGNTGFDKSDYLGKFRLNTNADAKVFQSLDFKIQYSQEESNETYLGLTDADFEADPYRRYLASSEDLMTASHQQYQLNHVIKPSSALSISTTAYSNTFKRNWYKLGDVTIGEKVSINNVLTDPEAYPREYGALLGINDTQDDVFGVKANNRVYTSQGIQTLAKIKWGTNIYHNLEVGVRYHWDEEDRFQWVDRYAIQNQEMVKTTAAEGGSDSNRVSDATAIASHMVYKVTAGKFTVTPGLRYENITLTRTDYGKNDPLRAGDAMTVRENSVDVWIPGIGISYRLNNNHSFFGGVHKGFSPPGSKEGEEAERSINYELGTRFNYKGFRGEVVAYYNDYQNLLGSDLAATGGTGDLDQFNAGEVRVSGVEVLMSYNLLSKVSKKIRMPLSVSYTLTDTEFLSSFESTDDIFGDVTRGDEIPYIAKNQFNATLSIESNMFDIGIGARYTDGFRTVAGTGNAPENLRVNPNFIMDVSGRYFLTKKITLSTNLINVLNKKYAVSRVPAGLRPGHPFGVNFGASYNF